MRYLFCDGIFDVSVHGGVLRVDLSALAADGEPGVGGTLLVPAEQASAFVDALGRHVEGVIGTLGPRETGRAVTSAGVPAEDAATADEDAAAMRPVLPYPDDDIGDLIP